MQPTSSDLTARDWAKRGEQRYADPPAIWCYRTLGRNDCFTEPQPGQEYRLMEGGAQPPMPASLPPTEEDKVKEARLFLFGE